MPPCPQKSGLTLVEVLIALAILSASAGVLLMATSRCLNVVSTAKNYYEARRILEVGDLEHPVLVIKKADDPGAAEDKAINLTVGPVDYPGGFTFSRTCERSETYEDLLVIRTRASWSKRGKAAFEEVTTYLYFTNDLAM
jgi:prepilin-type N-terminal cleavage/methylation domain-containing protein